MCGTPTNNSGLFPPSRLSARHIATVRQPRHAPELCTEARHQALQTTPHSKPHALLTTPYSPQQTAIPRSLLWGSSFGKRVYSFSSRSSCWYVTSAFAGTYVTIWIVMDEHTSGGEGSSAIEQAEQKALGTTTYNKVEVVHRFADTHPWFHPLLVGIGIAVLVGVVLLVMKLRQKRGTQ